MRVLTADGSQKVQVNATVPGPAVSYLSATALAAGASSTLDGPQVTAGKTLRLVAVEVASSVAVKALVHTLTNGVASASPLAGGFGWQGRWRWDCSPAGINLITATYDAAAGLDGFRVVVTNLDPALPADVLCWLYTSEV